MRQSTSVFTRGLCAASTLLVVLPIVGAVVAARGGWMPFGDVATIMIRSLDTLSAHPPLVGIYSSATTATANATTLYHPGPFQQWWTALPLTLFAPSPVGALLATALATSLAVATWLVAAWRQGHIRQLSVVLVALSVWLYAYGPVAQYTPYHSNFATVALLGFAGAAWAVACGDAWFLPIAVMFGSASAQIQVGFLPPVAGVLFALVIWLILDRRHTRIPMRSIAVSAVAAFLVWSGPLFDQFFRTGNLLALATSGGSEARVGVNGALVEAAHALSFPPSWLFRDLNVDTVLALPKVAYARPDVWALLSALIVLALVVVAFRDCMRHRRRVVGSLALIGVGAFAGSMIATAIMPSDPVSVVGHREFWRVSGFLLWLFVGLWSVTKVAESFAVPLRVHTIARRAGVSTVLVVVLGLATLTPSQAAAAKTSGSATFGAVRHLGATGAQYCARSGSAVALYRADFSQTATMLGIATVMMLDGCTVHTDPAVKEQLPGPNHRVTGKEAVTLLVSGVPMPPPGYARIAFYDPAHPSKQYVGFTGDPKGIGMQREYLYRRIR